MVFHLRMSVASSRKRIASTTTRSVLEPVAMMLLVRASGENRSGTSEFSFWPAALGAGAVVLEVEATVVVVLDWPKS